MNSPVRPFRILFVTATRLGDAVLSCGVLDRLLAIHPGARVTIACGPVAAGLFAAVPGLDEVIVVAKRRWDLHWFDLWRRCVRRRWDLAVDLRGSAVTLLLPARRRVIMRGGRRPGHRITHLAGALGMAPPPSPRVWIGAEATARAAVLLPESGALLALGPTANWNGKVWPAPRFAALAASLPSLRPVVFSGPGPVEHEAAGKLLALLPDAIDLRGCLSLTEVAACLSRCRLFVGNDSGLMHLSAATGIPTLGLFGPSRASEYAPIGPRATFCVAPGPEGAAPMEGLEVDLVHDAARTLLDRFPAAA